MFILESFLSCAILEEVQDIIYGFGYALIYSKPFLSLMCLLYRLIEGTNALAGNWVDILFVFIYNK